MELKPELTDDNALSSKVLIVPYGIETLYYKRKTRICEVLIVPYGIETHITPLRLHSLLRINCTLWNWTITLCV